MRLGLWSGLIAIAMLWGGGQNLYTALTNRAPTTLSCAEYVAQRPAAEWLALNACQLDVTESVFTGFGDDPSELFIPVFPVDADEDAKASIVLSTRDEKLLDLVRTLLAAGEDEAKLEVLALAHAKELFQTRDITGLVQFGIDLDDDERNDVAALGDSLAADFVIIEDGSEPNLGLGLGFTVVGLGIVGYFLVSLLRRKPSGGVSAPPA